MSNRDNEVFEMIEVGKQYDVIVKEPMNKSDAIYILQVDNGTS